jgi:hypothetical protein
MELNEASLQRIAQDNPKFAEYVTSLHQDDIASMIRLALSAIDTRLLVHPLVAAEIESLTVGKAKGATHEALARLAGELDMEYFRLRDDQDAPPSVWTPIFRQARLATALSYIAAGTSQSNIATIVYELAHAHGCPTSFYERLAQVQSTGGQF